MSPDEELNTLDKEIIRLQKSTRTTVPALLPLHDVLRHKFRWYYNWSSFRYSRALHVIFLLAFLFGIGGLFYRVLFYQPGAAKAAVGNVNPDGAVTAQWTAVGGTIPGILTDGSNATYISGDASAGRTNEYLSMQNLTIGYQATAVQVNVKYNTAATSSIGVKIYDGSVETVCGTDLGPSVSIVSDTRTCSSLTWSQTQVNNLQVRLTAKGSGATNVYENSATITYTISISGTSDQRSGSIVKVATGTVGSMTVSGQTGTISAVDGTWTINGVDISSSGDIVVAWIDNVLDASESTAITHWDGSGNITGMALNTNVLSVGSADNQSISVTDASAYTCVSDEDVMMKVSASVLEVDTSITGCAGASTNTYTSPTVNVLSGNTLAIAGTETLTAYNVGDTTSGFTGALTATGNAAINVNGNWKNGGTYTKGTETVTFNNTGAGQTLGGSVATAFNNVTLSNTGRTLTANTNFSVGGNLTLNASTTLSPDAGIVVSGAGTLTGSGTAQVKTNIASAFATQYTITNKTLTNLTVDYVGLSASGQTLTNTTYGSAGAGGLKISGTLNSLTQTATVGGAFTVAVGGNFSPAAGTITMIAGSIVNSGTLTFYDLTITTATVSTSSSFAVANNLTVSGGFSVTGSPTITVSGNIDLTGGSLAPGTSTFVMNGAGKNLIASGNQFAYLTISGNTNLITSDVVVSATLLINNNSTLTIDTGRLIDTWAASTTTIDVGSTITGAGTLSIAGAAGSRLSTTGTLSSIVLFKPSSVGADVTAPARTYGGDVQFTSTYATADTNAILSAGTTNFNANVSVNTTTGSFTFNLTGAAANPTINVTGNLTLNKTSGTPSIVMGNGTWTVGGNVTLTNGSVTPGGSTLAMTGAAKALTANGQTLNNLTISGTISSGSSFSVNGNWTNNGTFTHSAGTVTLSGASGSTQIVGGSSGTTFSNLTATSTAARTIQFTGNSTTTVAGTWTVTGNSYPGGLIALQSTNLNNWTINPATANVSYADVSRSTNSGPTFCATFSNDGGNNNSWNITSTGSCAPGAPDGVTITSIETGQFTVGWNDNSSNETNFRLWISTAANNDCSLATYDVLPTYTTGPNVTSQIAGSLSVNSRYCAKVTSKNDISESDPGYSLPKYTLANPPITPSHSAIATNSITWTWGKNSNPAWTEFYANDDSGINSGWVADASSWVATTGLKAANTQYTMTIKARNGDGVEAPEAPSVVQASAYTAIQTPTTITSGLITPNSIALNLSDTLTNLNIGSSGIQYAETSGNPGGGGEAAFTGWPQTASTTDASLQGALSGAVGTTYSYKIKARNAEGVETAYSADFPLTTTAGTQLLYQLPGETLDENGSTHLLSYSDSTPDTITAGVPFDLTIYAADGANYRDLAHQDTITLDAPSDPLAEFPATAAMTNGAITYSGVVMKTVGNQTISGTGSAGSSHEFVVVAGACSASISTASAAPTSLDTDETSTVTINLKDAFGNSLAGHTVSTGSDQAGDNITFSDVATDVNGRIFAYVTSALAHTSTLTVGDTTLGSLCTLDDHPQITFNEVVIPTPTPSPSPSETVTPSPTPTPTPTPTVTPDQPPSAPTNLRATDIGTTTIDLAWNASTDDVGVSGYELYNADTNIKIATTVAISYHLSGLSPDTTYRFYVRAFDTAGQFSSNSNTLSVTTNKIEGPPEEGIVAFLVMSNLPDSINAGQEFPNNVRVSAADAGGKIIDTYNKAVFFSSSDKNARLAVDAGHMYTFTSSDAGIHEFPGNGFVLNTGGKQKLTVSDYSTSSTMEIEVIAAPVVPSVVRDFFTNPKNMSNVNTGVVTTTAAVLLIPFLINTAFSLGTLFPQIAYWFLQLLELLGVRKRRKSWGVIFNSQSGQAVPLAMVRIFDRQYNRVLEQVVTDDQGRYGFLVREGTFYIQASKSGYTFPSKEKSSSFYEKIYVGGDFKIAGKDQTVAFNIPMDPHTKPGFAMSLWIFTVKLNRLLQKLRLPLLLLGLIFAVVMIFVSYNIIYLLSLVFYVLLAVLEYLRTFKARPYGIVTDTYNHPLGMVIVRIYRKDNNRLLETDVTDSQGRFRFLVAPGVYYLVAAKPGYVDFKSHLMYLQKEKTQVSTTIKLKKEEK